MMFFNVGDEDEIRIDPDGARGTTGLSGIVKHFTSYHDARRHILNRAEKEVEQLEISCLKAQQRLRRCQRIPDSAKY